MGKNIIACIDGSIFSDAVCDAASWAAGRLAAPLHLLNVTDKLPEDAESKEQPDQNLDRHRQIDREIEQLDQQRAHLARERGDAILEKSAEHIAQSGVPKPKLRQYKGDLVNIVEEMEDEIRLLILGKRGAETGGSDDLGSHLEQMIRTLHRPMLIVMEQFTPPQRVMMAFDGSPTTAKGVQLIAQSPLFKGIECHVVQVGADTDEHREQMRWAERTLEEGDIPTTTRLLVTNDIDASLAQYADDNAIDMLIMGAYSHSKLRQLLVGSNTTRMLRHASRPLLILR